jgi:hypothetical protein
MELLIGGLQTFQRMKCNLCHFKVFQAWLLTVKKEMRLMRLYLKLPIKVQLENKKILR